MRKTKIKHGHTVKQIGEGRIVVSDDSNEAGTVDQTRDIEVCDRSMSIPVVEDGCHTVASFDEAMFIADITGMKIRANSGTYRVVRVN